MEIPETLDIFKEMLYLQNGLLLRIIPIEKIPPPPVDLNTKSSQKIVKSFIARFTEEMVEAYAQLYNTLEHVSSNNQAEAEKSVRNYNVEIADATHFLLDVLIYSGIDNSMVDSMVYKYMQDEIGSTNIYKAGDNMGNLMRIADFLNYQDEEIVDCRRAKNFNVFPREYTVENQHHAGGNYISPRTLYTHARLLWHLTCEINLAANELKNREHHQRERLFDFISYHEKIVQTLIAWAQYLNFAGVTQRGLYQIYKIKNDHNHERITNGY